MLPRMRRRKQDKASQREMHALLSAAFSLFSQSGSQLSSASVSFTDGNCRRLRFRQQLKWPGKQLSHLFDEANAVSAVDDSMVIRKRQRQEEPSGELFLAPDAPPAGA